jgi:hypothetical protein
MGLPLHGARLYDPDKEALFGPGFVFSLLSSGRSCRLADRDFHTHSLIEDFSKEKVDMEGRSDYRPSRFFLLCQWS